jgi:hypothetical protein
MGQRVDEVDRRECWRRVGRALIAFLRDLVEEEEQERVVGSVRRRAARRFSSLLWRRRVDIFVGILRVGIVSGWLEKWNEMRIGNWDARDLRDGLCLIVGEYGRHDV